MAASDALPVHLFREILIWPLALAGARADARATVRAVDEALAAPWERVADPRRHLDGDGGGGTALSRDAYAEVVYFHPFVRNLLFPASGKADGDKPVRLYRRTDIRQVRLRGAGKRDYRLAVDRVNLTVFDTGIAVLALEVSSACGRAVEVPDGAALQTMTLGDALLILNRLRRAHPAYWVGDAPGECFTEVAWLTSRPGEPDAVLPAGPETDPIRTLEDTGQPGAFAHWADVLAPLRFTGGGDPRLKLRHVVDDRIPTMVLLGVDEPRDIERGDWARLCFCDEPGGGLPYAEHFLDGFEARHCYDRFWDGGKGWQNTRILFAGYNMAMVGQAHDGRGSFLRGVLQTHFRRHYFQLGLLALFQKAALLSLSDDVSHAVTEPDDRLRTAMTALHRRVLAFTHRHWFPDVTNQTQGQELFDLWRRHLNTQAAFDQLTREVAESHAFLEAQAQGKAAEAALRLNVLAAVGLVFALTTGALGMNVLIGGKWHDTSGWAEAAILFVSFTALMATAWNLSSCTLLRRWLSRPWLVWGIVVAMLAVHAALVFAGAFPTKAP